jgi:hypothetical protein
VKRVVYAWPQAADVPLDDVEEVEAEADDEAAGFASGFAGDEPVDDPFDESDALADDDVAGALLDEEPRLSFR